VDSSQPNRQGAVSRLTLGAAIATIGLTAVTFWLSYEALHTLAAGHGLTGERAWAWPMTIDAFIIIGEILILRASLLRRIDWLAVFLTAAGSIGSIVLNVASAGTVDTMTKVVHAVPPCASLLVFTALMRQIYRALSEEPADVSAPVGKPAVSVTTQVVSAPSAPVIKAPPMPAVPPVIRPALAPPAEPQPTPADTPSTHDLYDDPKIEAIRQLYDAGTRPTTKQMIAAVAAETGITIAGSTARTARTVIEAVEPHLAELPTTIATGSAA